MTAVWPLARGALFRLDPETAHEATLRMLELGLYPRLPPRHDGRLAQTLFGLEFPNPIGMAAGFDKDARVYNALFGMGFGFAEAGTIPPLPQPGNPRPRIFRLPSDGALINRFGFNSEGQVAAKRRLEANRPRGVLGLNIGANKESADPIADYRAGVRNLGKYANYVTVNISSPNTPGLRDLQAPDRLAALLAGVMEERARLQRQLPILVKLAPDMHDADVPAIVECLLAHNVDGVILTNTTVSRAGLSPSPSAGETGGLSGRPLFTRSTRFLARFYLACEGKLPLIGVGGIDSASTAIAKLRAGASLLQLYTALIYEGPQLLAQILNGLSSELDRVHASSIREIIGADAEVWAAKALED